jgi:MFS family permease
VEALRDRNFRLLFAARGISYVGTYLAPIAVAFAVLDLGGSATEVGFSFAAWTIAQVSTLAFGGVVGDRFPRRLVMIASDAGTVQRMIPPDKLARVAAYGWMGAMVFPSAGYALAGPISSVVGMRGYLLFGAGWLVASTLAVVRVRSVREVTAEPVVEAAPVAASA